MYSKDKKLKKTFVLIPKTITFQQGDTMILELELDQSPPSSIETQRKNLRGGRGGCGLCERLKNHGALG